MIDFSSSYSERLPFYWTSTSTAPQSDPPFSLPKDLCNWVVLEAPSSFDPGLSEE